MEHAELWAKAQAAARAAAIAENDSLPPENARGFDCGFAWVVIKPARGAFVKFLKDRSIGRTRSYDGGGLEIWYSKLHDVPTQSISVHVAAARAAVEVLNAAGVKCFMGSRLD